MSAMTRQQVLDEICRPLAGLLNGLYEDAQRSPEAEQAWRGCVARGRPPVYVAGYVGMQLIEVRPPEGWLP